MTWDEKMLIALQAAPHAIGRETILGGGAYWAVEYPKGHRLKRQFGHKYRITEHGLAVRWTRVSSKNNFWRWVLVRPRMRRVLILAAWPEWQA